MHSLPVRVLSDANSPSCTNNPPSNNFRDLNHNRSPPLQPPRSLFALTDGAHGGTPDATSPTSASPRDHSASPRSQPHARSFSDKLLGSRKTKAVKINEVESTSMPLSTDTNMSERVHPVGRPGKTRVDDSDLASGQCATCGCKVKWPRSLNEFRCSTCLMINDLKITQLRGNASREPGPSAMSRAGSYPGRASGNRATPVTIEQTQSIINRCVDTYLDSRRHEHKRSKGGRTRTPARPPRVRSGSPNGSPKSPEGRRVTTAQALDAMPCTPPDELSLTQTFAFSSLDSSQKSPPPQASIPRRPPQHRSPARVPAGSVIPRKPVAAQAQGLGAKSTRRPTPAPVKPPTRSESQHLPADRGRTLEDPTSTTKDEIPSRQAIPASKVFKPLEDYLVRTFGDQESLNTSFLRSRPRPPVSASSEDKKHTRRSVSPPRVARMPDAPLPGLDAKTLLLGDVAENGLWWTGRDGPAPIARRQKSDRVGEDQRNLVASRSPLIIWSEVEAWYSMVLGAGSEWRLRWRTMTQVRSTEKDHEEGNMTGEDDLEADLHDGRSHLHRTLLKITENLLKRPGRPLRDPSDTRFLLLLLANPLLYPTLPSTAQGSRRKPVVNQQNSNETRGSYGPSRTTSVIDPVESAWDRGDVYGILKRIFGLLSNLPSDFHRHLTAWFARYDELRFRQLVELIQRFTTYRLMRQRGRKKSFLVNPVDGLIPSLTGTSADTSAQLHAALGLSNQKKGGGDSQNQHASYSDDWQVKAAARVMSLLFHANRVFQGMRSAMTVAEDAKLLKPGNLSRTYIKNHGQLLSTSEFYNSMVDLSDLIADFDLWESSKSQFAFCQYPFYLSVGSKIRIMEHDAKRQMEVRAREAFFNSLLKNKPLEQYLTLRVRRQCLVEDSLSSISEVVGAGHEDIKKGLKVQFVNEEGIDAGGLKKEWFLLLAREIFDPHHALFLYDEESHLCYFNPHSFETSDQFFLVGALLGLAIYNSIILDLALPPITFKKLLLSASPSQSGTKIPQQPRAPLTYSLEDLAEYRPVLARGLHQLLTYSGDVQSTFCRDFVIDVDRYGSTIQVPLCENGTSRPVTNANRVEFVDLYVRYLLDTQVTRQFEPFKRGFFTVCGGNALSLFQPEEIELLVRGSAEPLDVPSLRAVAVYENWKDPSSGRAVCEPADTVPLLVWFWGLFEEASTTDQRKLLSFITSSDRIPATGAASLVIKVAYAGPERGRYPIARTCFNLLLLYGYGSKVELGEKLWRAVRDSEGFGLR